MIEAEDIGLWTAAQVRLVVACDLVAVLVVALAARGAADQASLGHQVTWVDVAILGLLLAVVTNGALFLTGRRAIGQRRLALVPNVIASAAPAPTVADGGWWWLPGMTRAHLHDCQLIAGKPAEAISAKGIRAHHLVRCEVCG